MDKDTLKQAAKKTCPHQYWKTRERLTSNGEKKTGREESEQPRPRFKPTLSPSGYRVRAYVLMCVHLFLCGRSVYRDTPSYPYTLSLTAQTRK